MTSLMLNIAEVVQQSIDSIPPKYRKIISSGTVVVGLWALRNAFWRVLNRLRSYPAGPLGLPFFGCFLPFAIRPASFAMELGRKYGSVAYVPLMMSNNVFINDPLILRQLFQTMKITSRPPSTFRKVLSFGVINGDEWVSRRQFFTQTAMTLSKSSFVLNSVRRAMLNVEPRMEQLIQRKALWVPNDDVQYFAVNNAWALIFDHVLSIDDPIVTKYSKMQEHVANAAMLAILIDILSNFSEIEIVAKNTTWKDHEAADQMLIEWMNQNGFEVDRDRKIFKRVNGKKSESTSKDKVYADFLIDKLEHGLIEYDQIWPDFEMALAGALDTVSASSAYGFLLLAKHPVVQQRLYEELGLFNLLTLTALRTYLFSEY